MKWSQIYSMPDDGGGPVWTRARKPGGNPIVGFFANLLMLIGVLTLILAGVSGGSFSKGGSVIDGWIGSVQAMVSGAKSKAVAMDQSTPVEPASAPASSADAAAKP